jgi:hypothetical protein
MAKNWSQIIGGSATVWSIPLATVHQLTALAGEAETALADAQNEITTIIGWSFATGKTPKLSGYAGQHTAHCKEAFKAMETHMRDLKKRYLYVPPLTEADLVSLDLKIPDAHPTPSGTPTAQVTIETFLVGRHELGIKIVYVTGNPNDPANKGYRIWYSVIAPGAPPQTTMIYANHFLPNGKKM